MKKIIIITGSYPYNYQKESTFIENEVNSLLNSNIFEIVLIPVSNKYTIDYYDKRLFIDVSLANKIRSSVLKKILIIIKYIFSKNYINSLRRYGLKFINIQNIINYALRYHEYMTSKKYFYSKLYNNEYNINETIFYTFWFFSVTDALCDLKNKYYNDLKVITRVHRGDLYEESSIKPFREDFISHLNKIYSVSESGSEYLKVKFPECKDKIFVQKIGIKNPINTDRYINKKEKIFISCSYISPIKRVDKIYDSINAFTCSYQINVHWIHFGGGDLKKLKKHIRENPILDSRYFSYKLEGNIYNNDIINYYKRNQIDLFINLSESEGIPVSIMEAQSYFIPVLATNVGGVSEVVNKSNGFLVEKDFKIHEVVDGINNIIFNQTYDKFRLNSKKSIFDNHDSIKVYEKFIEDLRIL